MPLPLHSLDQNKVWVQFQSKGEETVSLDGKHCTPTLKSSGHREVGLICFLV